MVTENAIEITLSDFEIKIAKRLGSMRHNNARTHGIVDAKVGDQSNEETDVESMAAEIAFCKIHNLYPDLQIAVIPDFDAVLPCGAKVDVKQTKYRNGRLLARLNKKEKPADIYVLMTGTIPTFTERGGLAAEMLFQDDMIIDLGHGPGFGATQDKLWTVDQLVWRFEHCAVDD